MARLIPETHEYLLSDDRPVVAALATVMPDGSPQLTPVWFDREGDLIRINTNRARVKNANMTARPRVALLMIDPDDIYRHLQIRGQVVESTEQGAQVHIESLSQKYRGRPFRKLAPGEVRVIYKIRPLSVTAE